MALIWWLDTPLPCSSNLVLLLFGFLALGALVLLCGGPRQQKEATKRKSKKSKQKKQTTVHKCTDQLRETLKMGFLLMDLLDFSECPMDWAQEDLLCAVDRSICRQLQRERSRLMEQQSPKTQDTMSTSNTEEYVLPSCGCRKAKHSTHRSISSESLDNMSCLSHLPICSEGSRSSLSQLSTFSEGKIGTFRHNTLPGSPKKPEKSRSFQKFTDSSLVTSESSFINSVFESPNLYKRRSETSLTSDGESKSVSEKKPPLSENILDQLNPSTRWKLERHIASLQVQSIPLVVRESWATLKVPVESQEIPEQEKPQTQASIAKMHPNVASGLNMTETSVSQSLIPDKLLPPRDGPRIFGSSPLVAPMGIGKIQEETTLLPKHPKHMLELTMEQQKTQVTDVELITSLPYQMKTKMKVTSSALRQVLLSMGMIPESHSEVTESGRLSPRPQNPVMNSMETQKRVSMILERQCQVTESGQAMPKLQESKRLTARAVDRVTQVTDTVKRSSVALFEVTDHREMINKPHPHMMGSVGMIPRSQSRVETVKMDHPVLESGREIPVPPYTVTETMARTPEPPDTLMEAMNLTTKPQSEPILRNTKSLKMIAKPFYRARDNLKITPGVLLQTMSFMGIIPPGRPRSTGSGNLTEDSQCQFFHLILRPVQTPGLTFCGSPATKPPQKVGMIPKPPSHEAIRFPAAHEAPKRVTTAPQSQMTESLELSNRSCIQVLQSVGMTAQPHRQGTDSVSLTAGPLHQAINPSWLTPHHQRPSSRPSLQVPDTVGLTSDPPLPMKKSEGLAPSHHQRRESSGRTPGSHRQDSESMRMSQKALQQVARSAVMTTASLLQGQNYMEVKPVPQLRTENSVSLFTVLQSGKSDSLTLGPKLQSVQSVVSATGSRPRTVKHGQLITPVDARNFPLQKEKSEALVPTQSMPSVSKTQLQGVRSTQVTLGPQFQSVKPAELAPAPKWQSKQSAHLTPSSPLHRVEDINLTLPPEFQNVKTVDLTLIPVQRELKSVKGPPKSWSQENTSEDTVPGLLLDNVKTRTVTPPKVESRLASEICPQEGGPVKVIPEQVMETYRTTPETQPQTFTEMASGPGYEDTGAGRMAQMPEVRAPALISGSERQRETPELLVPASLLPDVISVEVNQPPGLKKLVSQPQTPHSEFIRRPQSQRMKFPELIQESQAKAVKLGIQLQEGSSLVFAQGPELPVTKSAVLSQGPPLPSDKTGELKPRLHSKDTQSSSVTFQTERQDVKSGEFSSALQKQDGKSCQVPPETKSLGTKFIGLNPSVQVQDVELSELPMETKVEGIRSMDSNSEPLFQGVKASERTSKPELQDIKHSESCQGSQLQAVKSEGLLASEPQHAKPVEINTDPHLQGGMSSELISETTFQVELKSGSHLPSFGAQRGLTQSILGRQQNIWENRACKRRLPRKYLSNMAMLGNALGSTRGKRLYSQLSPAERPTADTRQAIQKLFGVPAELMTFPPKRPKKGQGAISEPSVAKNYIQRHTSCHGREKRKPLRLWTRASISSIIQQYYGNRVGIKKTNAKLETIEQMSVSHTGDQIPASINSESSFRKFLTGKAFIAEEESGYSQSDSQGRIFEPRHSFEPSSSAETGSEFSGHSQLQRLPCKVAAKFLKNQPPPHVTPPLERKATIDTQASQRSTLTTYFKAGSLKSPVQIETHTGQRWHGSPNPLRIRTFRRHKRTQSNPPPESSSESSDDGKQAMVRPKRIPPRRKTNKERRAQSSGNVIQSASRESTQLKNKRIGAPHTSALQTMPEKSSELTSIKHFFQGLKQAFQRAHQTMASSGQKDEKAKPNKVWWSQHAPVKQKARDFENLSKTGKGGEATGRTHSGSSKTTSLNSSLKERRQSMLEKSKHCDRTYHSHSERSHHGPSEASSRSYSKKTHSCHPSEGIHSSSSARTQNCPPQRMKPRSTEEHPGHSLSIDFMGYSKTNSLRNRLNVETRT